MTMAPDAPVAITLMLAGQLMVGGVTSFTVIVNVHVEVFPPPSVAVAVTVEVPRANVLPDAGEYPIVVPGQLSVAVAE